jgi:hypothetical protein
MSSTPSARLSSDPVLADPLSADRVPAHPVGLRLVNEQLGTEPLVVHAHGHHRNHPHWPPIRDAFFRSAPATIGASARVTVITCNNGAQAMGLLERGLEHLGVPYRVGGQGVRDWVNARDKPRAIRALLDRVDTPYVLYADSRDALILGNPEILVDRFEDHFETGIVFGADRLSWPPLARFKRFEREMAAGQPGDFHYLNGGTWIGRTPFCRDLFTAALEIPAVPEAPDSEQGILRTLWMDRPSEIALDYRCRMFQNIGFVAAPIFRIDTGVRDR